MTYSWQNEDGEPIMSGEAWRFEQALDAENPPYDPDDYLAYDDDGDYIDPEDCDHGDVNYYGEGDKVSAWCIKCDSETDSVTTDEDGWHKPIW